MVTKEDSHYQGILRSGIKYLRANLDPQQPAEERSSVISAAFRYLVSRDRRTSTAGPSQAGPASQSQTTHLSQSAPQNPTRTNNFVTLLAEALNFETKVPVLLNATKDAARLKLLPVLTKCLSIVAKHKSLSESSLDDELLQVTKKRKAESSSPDKRKSKKSKAANGSPSDTGADVSDDDDDEADRKSRGCSGRAYVDDFVTDLVRYDADEGHTDDDIDFVFAASCAREAPLSPSASKTVLINLIHNLQHVPISELPNFVYQVMLFSSTKSSIILKKRFIVALAARFSDIESNVKQSDQATQTLLDEDEDAITTGMLSSDEIYRIQGVTLFHIDFALKQDPTFVDVLIKLTKGSVETQAPFMSPFGIAILMAISRSPLMQNDVLTLIRQSLVKFEQERTIRETNLFASRVAVKDKPLCHPIESLCIAARRTVGYGWEFIAEPFFRFACLLLDKPLAEQRSLAVTLLTSLFRGQPSMRKAILEQIISRIALRDKSARDVISLLDILTDNEPLDVLELSSHVKNCIEECVRLPPVLATSLITALKPLIRTRRDLLDYYFIVMRKALFYHEANSRAVAAIGFLSTLSFRSLKPDIGAASANRKNAKGRALQKANAMRNKLTDSEKARIRSSLSPLKRTFTFPPVVKALLYRHIRSFVPGLHQGPERDVVCENLCVLLKAQLVKFVHVSEAPYLLIDLCVDEECGGVLREPLGDLIQCLTLLESLKAGDPKKESYIVDLARRLCTVGIADFAISKDVVDEEPVVEGDELSEEAIAAIAAAKANRVKARVLGSATEALISASLEFGIAANDEKVITEVVHPLLSLRGKVIETLKSLRCTSISDVYHDLGSSASIEAAEQPPINLRGSRKATAVAKKSAKGGKGNGKSASKQVTTAGGGNSSSSGADMLLGAFTVMYSAVSSPVFPMEVALKCLQCMTNAQVGSDGISNYFTSRRADKDVSELRSFVLAIALQHIQNTATGRDGLHNVSLETVRDIWPISIKNISDDFGDRGKFVQILEACAKLLTSPNRFSKNKELFEAMVASLCKEETEVEAEYEGDKSDKKAMEIIEKACEKLLESEAYKDCTGLLRTYSMLSNCIESRSNDLKSKSSVKKRQIDWARKILLTHEGLDSNVVRILSTLASSYSIDNHDLKTCQQIVDRVHVVVGDCDANEEAVEPTLGHEKDSLSLATSISRSTSVTAADSLLDNLDTALDDVEWCLNRTSNLEAVVDASNEFVGDESRGFPFTMVQKERKIQMEFEKLLNLAEDAALKRLSHVLENLITFCGCALVKWAVQERVLRCATRAYKFVSLATSACHKRRGDPRTSYIDLIDKIKELGPFLWKYVTFMASDSGREESSKARKAAKEGHVMGSLIFEVERFEKLLISLQKKVKTINLLKNFKRNTARDFRVHENLFKDGSQEE